LFKDIFGFARKFLNQANANTACTKFFCTTWLSCSVHVFSYRI